MYTRSKTVNWIFGNKHKAYMAKCIESQINVAEGAVRAGKTVDNVFAFAYLLERTPDKLHLASGSTGANAKLNIGYANGYGLEAIFRGRYHWGKYKDNEAMFVRDGYGRDKVIIFAGGGKNDSFKKIRGNSYGMWIATEINLHADSFIKEAMNRQLAAVQRKIFWDLNPDHPKAKIYKDYLDSYAAKAAKGELIGGYNYEHFTIFDNATMTKERIQEIISQYDQIRDDYGEAIEIADADGSGFRCRTHNAAVGGAVGSLHLTGDAFDLHCRNKAKLLSVVEKHITDGEIGSYNWGIHAGVWNRGFVNRFQK